MHRTGRWNDTPRRIVYSARITHSVRIAAAGLLLITTLLVIVGCASAAPTTKSPTTSRPVVEGPLASVVGPAASPLAQRVNTAYDAIAHQARVTITISAAPDVATAQSRVMSLCFQVERALWTSNPALREVKVIVLGPIRDDYSNIIDDAYGVSDVLAPTAAKLPWNTLTPESAWTHYDATWLRASYKPNWLYGKNN